MYEDILEHGQHLYKEYYYYLGKVHRHCEGPGGCYFISSKNPDPQYPEEVHNALEKIDKSFPPFLKPCPFCGGEAKFALLSYGAQHIECEKCHTSSGIGVPVEGENIQFILAQEWNKRVK